MELFLCPVCQQRLDQPVTLSCGFTICRHCIPPPSDKTDVFTCPVRYCHSSAHLFNRSLDPNTDLVVDQLLQNGAGVNGCKEEIMRCGKCADTLYDPVTNHCGHVYCRACLLTLKIEGASCLACRKPLPRYNYIQYEAVQNRLLQYHLGKSKHRQASKVHSNRCHLSFVYVTGLVILPLQHVRIPVVGTTHMRMLRQAIFQSGSSLFFPAIHRGPPAMALYGTIVEIIGVEQRSESIVILDVVGRERFKTARDIKAADHHNNDDEGYNGIPAEGTPGNQEPSIADARAIHAYLCQLAVAQPPRRFLSTSIVGLLGPSWFELMENTHGSLPPPHQPDALAWWAAIVLPLTSKERYSLLKTDSLQKRLHMVMIWIKALNNQWQSWRQAAINSYADALSAQSTETSPPL
ncbi:hypothetical protein BX666DRAFT_2100999 [Dichotomocladium elegans]|nr:hypothetical protein BX666DRAFT_2100999 [Dichotomocladium elegans]